MTEPQVPTGHVLDRVFAGVSWCVLRREDNVPDALEGKGDIDILVSPDHRPEFETNLAGLGALPGQVHPHHDNALASRQDWFVLNPDNGAMIHLDVHYAVCVGPRYAKTIELASFDEARPLIMRDLGPVSVPVASAEFRARLEIVRAAFRSRSLFPSAEATVEVDALLVAPDIEIAGHKLVLRDLAQGTARVAGEDLRTVRHAVLRKAGEKPPGLRLWARNLRRYARYKLARAMNRLGLSPVPHRGPRGRGLVIALLGPDGMGKSSQSETLGDTFRPKFGVRSIYLGSSGFVSRIYQVLFPGSMGSPTRRKPASGKKRAAFVPALFDMVRAFWGLWLAYYRLRAMRKARRLADKGYIVIADRWPQNLERGLLDGPVRRRARQSWPWVEKIYAYEWRMYQRLDAYRPDLAFHLVAPFEVAEARKPGELTAETYRRRIDLLEKCRDRDPEIIEIDAAEPFDAVQDRIFSRVWSTLVDQAATLDKAGSADKHVWSSLTYVVGGQVAQLLGQIGILSAMSHLRGSEAVGIFGLAMTVVTPTFILMNMGLRTTQSLDQQGRFTFAEYAGFRLLTTTVAMIVITAIAVTAWSGTQILPVVMLFAIAKAFESASGLSYGAFLRKERVELVFRSFALRSSATLVLFIAVLLTGAPLWAAFLSQVVVWAAVALWVDLPSAWAINAEDRRRVTLSWSVVKSVLYKTYPIGGMGFLIGLQPALLRLFVEAHMGLAALGVFTNISAVFQAGAMVSNAARQFLAARFSRLKGLGDLVSTIKVARMLLLSIAAMGVVAIAIVMMWGSELLYIVFGSATSEHADLLVLVTFALCFRLLSAVTISLSHAYDRAVSQFALESVNVLLLLALSQIFIPGLGLLAAGWIMVVTSAVRFAADGYLVLLRLVREHRDSGN